MEPVNILMVDDQPAKLLAYEAILGELGENLIKANTAREALARLLRDEIAVVLMDVSMPEIDGFELASMIRQHPRCQRTAIIFVSAVHLSDEDRVKGYQTGAVDYVSVPVVPEILRAKIRVFLELHRKTTELRRLNEELEARVRRRTDDLEASLDRLRSSEARLREQGEVLEKADRRKDEFLAMLAHELRNPLAPIRNVVEIMRMRADEPREYAWMRNMIDRQVKHLVRLVDDLLDASRISRGKLVLSTSPVELTQLIADAVESARSSTDNAMPEIVIAGLRGPIHVEGDAVRLTQVFLNLLNNAIKFTPATGRVTLFVESAQDGVAVRIADTGRGINPQDLAHVFEMFYQGETGTGNAKAGLGLGLTLVQNLVEMHGGSVSASSGGRDKGCEFRVRLPLAPATAEVAVEHGPPAHALRSATRRRILVVDDNRDIVESLAEALRLAGNDVDTALDGDAAMNAVAKFRPDIVLLDIGMPFVDGYAAARAIRRDRRGKEILLVALTGWGQAEDRRRVVEAGFDAHLVKPATVDALLEVFESVKPGGMPLPAA